MKRLFLGLLLIFGSTEMVFSQSLISFTAREYFLENILTLDPIEGIYDIDNSVRAVVGNMQDIHHQSVTWVVTRKQDNVFNVHMIDKSTNKQGNAGTIERIGDTSYYKFIGFFGPNATKKEMRFSLSSYYGFEIEYTTTSPYEGTVYNHITAIREFPTRSEIEAERNNKNAGNTVSDESKWNGSGFALKDGYIVTNYHVVEGASTIFVRGINGDFRSSYKASVVAIDKNNDLAIIKVSDSSFNGQFNVPPYSVKTAVADVGEDVFILGYPLTAAMGDEIKYTTGVVSSKTGFQGDITLYQISAPVQPGNSGGPLFDSKGNIIGIVNSKLTGAENVNYAIKTSYLSALAGNISESVLPTTNSVSSLSRPNQIKKLGNFVYLITCEKATGQ